MEARRQATRARGAIAAGREMKRGDSKLRIGVIGGGGGGLTAALAFRRCGFEVKVFERSHRDREIGAGVGNYDHSQLGPVNPP
jgi:NADPH-dependent 2,4-dienoyl-CoA reductase/sulfur reductase-like enzyme